MYCLNLHSVKDIDLSRVKLGHLKEPFWVKLVLKFTLLDTEKEWLLRFLDQNFCFSGGRESGEAGGVPHKIHSALNDFLPISLISIANIDSYSTSAQLFT